MTRHHTRLSRCASAAASLILLVALAACGGAEEEPSGAAEGEGATADVEEAAPSPEEAPETEGEMAEPAAPETDAELVPLQVAPPSPSIVAMAAFYIAEHEGFFEEEGADVELVTQVSAATLEAALVQGALDVAGGSPDGFLVQLGQDPDLPFRCIATISLWPFRVMVPPESPVQAPADLAGLRVGVPDSSDVPRLEFMLLAAGLDQETASSVEAIPVGGREPAAIEMARESIDAFMGSHVDQLAIENAGFPVRVIETVDVGSTYNSCMLVRAESLEDPEMRRGIEGFLRGLIRGSEIFYEEPERAIEIVAEARPEAVSDPEEALALLLATDEVNRPTYEFEFTTTADGWQDLVELFVDAGFIEESYDVSPYIDSSLVEEAWAEVNP